MEISLVYSSKDPRQARTRDFLRKFVEERGILARFVETEQPVKVPTIAIDGCCITHPKTSGKSAKKHSVPFPTLDEIARAVERNIWCL
jgi:hypothetical protein